MSVFSVRYVEKHCQPIFTPIQELRWSLELVAVRNVTSQEKSIKSYWMKNDMANRTNTPHHEQQKWKKALCDSERLMVLEAMRSRIIDQFAILEILPSISPADLERALEYIMGDT
jgi:hypothetical protein